MMLLQAELENFKTRLRQGDSLSPHECGLLLSHISYLHSKNTNLDKCIEKAFEMQHEVTVKEVQGLCARLPELTAAELSAKVNSAHWCSPLSLAVIDAVQKEGPDV